jgi:hypothetical protein
MNDVGSRGCENVLKLEASGGHQKLVRERDGLSAGPVVTELKDQGRGVARGAMRGTRKPEAMGCGFANGARERIELCSARKHRVTNGWQRFAGEGEVPACVGDGRADLGALRAAAPTGKAFRKPQDQGDLIVKRKIQWNELVLRPDRLSKHRPNLPPQIVHPGPREN